nr:glyoxalase superfamily protein [Streptomyces pacificus]
MDTYLLRTVDRPMAGGADSAADSAADGAAGSASGGSSGRAPSARPAASTPSLPGPGGKAQEAGEPGEADAEAVPVLRVADAAAAVSWYERLGFAKQGEHRSEPGLPAFTEIARGPVKLFLSEHTGDAGPGTLVYLRVGDVDAVAGEFGASVTTAPRAREVELRDPDGNRLRVGTPLE